MDPDPATMGQRGPPLPAPGSGSSEAGLGPEGLAAAGFRTGTNSGAFHGTAGARLTAPAAQRKESAEPSVVPRRQVNPTWRGGVLAA